MPSAPRRSAARPVVAVPRKLHNMSRYFFAIRWPDHDDSDQLGRSLPDDTAALNHAIRIVRGLRQGGEHDDPWIDDDRQKRDSQNGTVVVVPRRLRLMPSS
jgi:hypothetical protein